MILNLRGTSGTGKSTVVHKLLKNNEHSPIKVKGKIEAYEVIIYRGAMYSDRTLYVIGRYDTQCGGCDGIPTQDEVVRRVKKYAKKGDVLFEGLLVSHIYSRYAKLFSAYEDVYVWWIDTPLELCLERIRQRRINRGDERPFNPTITTKDWHSNQRTYDRFKSEGPHHINLKKVGYKNPYNSVMRLLRN